MERLQEQYDVFAPRLFPGTGCYSDTDVVRYGQISSLSEIVWDKKSEYSFKETLLPISDTVFYFTEDEVKVPDAPRKRRLIFLRSCELCALKRLDGIYLKNALRTAIMREFGNRRILYGCAVRNPSRPVSAPAWEQTGRNSMRPLPDSQMENFIWRRRKAF